MAVIVDDEGAEIYVDDVFAGNSPASLKLSDGQHVVEVKKDGIGVYRKEIRVITDSVVTLRVHLKP